MAAMRVIVTNKQKVSRKHASSSRHDILLFASLAASMSKAETAAASSSAASISSGASGVQPAAAQASLPPHRRALLGVLREACSAAAVWAASCVKPPARASHRV